MVAVRGNRMTSAYRPVPEPVLLERLRMGIFNLECRFALARFEWRTRAASHTNEKMLRAILKCNRDTEFGRKHGFPGLTRHEGLDLVTAFRREVPLSVYGDYHSYIERVAAGEQRVLSADRVLVLAGTGGTTDRPKRIPRTRDTQRHHAMLVVRAAQAVIDRAVPGASGSARGINLMSFYAPPAATGSVVPHMSGPGSGIRRVRRHIARFWCSPEAVFGLADQPTALYLHALFALLDRSALYIETPFAPQVVGWLALIERHQRQLVEDVRNGTLPAHLKLTATERDRLNACLHPNPERAEEITKALALGFEGILPRLWPTMAYIRTVTSGSFALALPRLRWLAGPELTIHSGCHAASEGVIGINLRVDGRNEYVLALGSAYFEFIPLAAIDEAQPVTLDVDELRPGDDYEVVLTNSAGLYRYRMGDVIRVTGLYGTAPTFQYLFRRGTILNLVGEKTSECHTTEAVMTALRELLGVGVTVKDYAVAGAFEDGLGRYTFYVELQSHSGMAPETLSRAADLLDQALCEVNPYYLRNGRAAERLASARIRIVRPGTFDSFAALKLERTGGISLGQVKSPRVLSGTEESQFFEQRVSGWTDGRLD
ncbi:MAG: hypothetical protein AMXMBFR45_02860 [Gammaproteobacteria bacterium]